MNVYIVKASAPGPYKTYKQQRGGPPQGIFSLAAATPPGVALELCDETGGMTPAARSDADVVVLFASTPDAYRAYELAARYREQGTPVVLAGLHASFLPEEAGQHADAVLIGEAEESWPRLLADLRHARLAPRYESSPLTDLSSLAPYPRDLVGPEQYGGFWSVLVARGCQQRCSFCLVNPFFGRQRHRPIGAIVDELRACHREWVELHADNLTVDRDYALELFHAIEPLGLKWVGETTIKIADDEELLRAAVDSGLQYLLVGLETPSPAALRRANKGFVEPGQAKEYIARLHVHQVIVDASMLFGFDEHDETIFEEAYDFVEYTEVDVSDGIIVIPFPGSGLFEELDATGRILSRDWSLYDGANVVFQPAKMSPEALAEGSQWFWEKRSSAQSYLRRKARQVRNVGASKAWLLGSQ